MNRNWEPPMELAICSQVDRFNLAIDIIDRVPKLQGPGAQLKEWLKGQIIESINYADTEGLDQPEIRDWRWPSGQQHAKTAGRTP
jgi:xylulose-5-phosphate/fructose-6-phosphate phosphoketolase